MLASVAPPADLLAARRGFLAGEGISPIVRPIVLAAWQRSAGYEVDPTSLRRQSLDETRLTAARERSRRLLERALPILERMHGTLTPEPHVIALADADGLILEFRACRAGTTAELAAANLFAGASWHERDIGCNGVGTCLATGEPVLLIGPEHYQEAYLTWTCIGVPVRDPGGKVLGAVDVSVPHQHTSAATWGWTLSVVREIETALAYRAAAAVDPSAELPLPDVRSPLQTIRGLLRFLGTQLNLTPSHAKYLGEAEQEVEAADQELQSAVERVVRSEEQARRELKEIEALYATAPLGLCVLDRELRYVRINPQLAELNGIPAETHIGRSVRDLLPELAPIVEPLLHQVLDSGQPLLNFELAGQTPAQPGTQRHWIEHYVPLRDDAGAVFAVNVFVEEVTEQKRAAAEIERLYQEAQHAIAQRDQVLAVVSHDLRNPLNTIGMASELLLMPLPEDRRQAQATTIRRCVEQATGLIEDLLDVARIEGGGLQLRPAPELAGELVRTVVDMHAPLAEAKAVCLVAEVNSERVIRADRQRLLQLLGNLVGNAIAFTSEQGSVVVSVADVEEGVCFAVRDDGVGIPTEHLPHLFDRFWQAGHARRGGAGLGLAIAKGIAEAHGGRIWAQSEPGKGATFRFTVPA